MKEYSDFAGIISISENLFSDPVKKRHDRVMTKIHDPILLTHPHNQETSHDF